MKTWGGREIKEGNEMESIGAEKRDARIGFGEDK